jgi:hypothetical protein
MHVWWERNLGVKHVIGQTRLLLLFQNFYLLILLPRFESFLSWQKRTVLSYKQRKCNIVLHRCMYRPIYIYMYIYELRQLNTHSSITIILI